MDANFSRPQKYQTFTSSFFSKPIMGSSESTQQQEVISSSSKLSSLGEPTDAFKNAIQNFANDGNIPAIRQDFNYTLYTMKAAALGHKSIVIVPQNNEQTKYGSFTIELCVNIKSNKVYLHSSYTDMGKTKQRIKAKTMSPMTYVIKDDKISILIGDGLFKKRYCNELVINTKLENFTNLAIDLIKHHGKYSSYCNNCQHHS